MSVNWDDFTPVNPPAQGGVNWDDFTPIEPKKRVPVPDMSVGSIAQDIAAGALQIGPTAVKGVADIARLATGDRVGKDTSEALERGMGSIRDMVGSERAAAQRANFQADMADDDVGIGETLARNKGALADQVLPTIGSMFLPVGVAGAAGKMATAGKAAQGMNAAALAARVAAVQKVAGIGTVAAQNAADTFAELLEKGVPMEDAYVGAGITVPFSVVAGVVTGGGAEGAITRALTGATAARAGIKQAGKAMAQEGGQEMGEEAGQIVGEAVGTGTAPSATSAAKQMAVAGTLGAVMGGGVDVANQAGQFRQEPEQQPAPTPAQPAPAAQAAAQPPAAAAPAVAPAQPTQTAALAATSTPAADPVARLAELEIISEQRDLAPVEQQEIVTLQARLNDEQDVPQGAQGADGALINEGTSPQAAPDQAAENAAGNAPAADGVPAAGGNADVQTAGVESAQAGPVAQTAPADFWSFAKSKGFMPGQIKVGTPEHATLKAEYDSLKGGAAPVLPPLEAPQDVNMQNRDRGRAASVVQMSDIARNPDYMRLGPSRTPDSGAPMVFAVGDDLKDIAPDAFGREDVAVMSDGQRVPFRYAVVDATKVNPSNFADGRRNELFDSTVPGTLKALNNGRTAGIRGAHELGTATDYVQAMQADTTLHGISPDIIARTPNAALVRVYSDSDNTAGMAAKSQGQGLGMSPAELARQDAPLMDSSVLAVYQPGEVTSAGNRDFVRSFIGKLQGAGQDVAGMMTADGQLSQDGRKRIQAALMQAAYGDSDIVEEMFDSTDTDIKAIGEALKTVAGQWANMRDSARLNAINPQADITDNLLQAIGLIRKARRDGMSLYDLVNQPDLMTGETPAEMTVGMLRLFYSGQYLTRAIGKEKLTQHMADYVQGAMTTSADAGMFGDVVTAGDILATIVNRLNEGQGNAEAQPQEGRGQSVGSVDTGRGTGEGQPGIGGQAAGEGGPGSNQDRGGQPGQNAQAQAQQQDGQGNQGGQESNGAQAAVAPGGQRGEPEAQAAGVKAEKPKKAAKPKTAKDSKTKAEKPAVKPSDAAQQLERDFRTFPTQILNNLLERGEAAKLYKAASVKGSSAFDGLAMDEKAAAYVKYVEQGGKPVEGLPKDYNAWAASQERDAVVRRLRSDRVVRQENGKPFKSQISAQQFQERYDLTGTHEVVQADGGFELRQLSIAAQAELKRKAEGRENYTEAQAAVAAEMGIGVNEDGEWDVTDAQFDELERRTAARLEGEKAPPRTEPEPLLTTQTPEEIVARQDAAEAAKREQEAADRKAREQERQAEERKRIAQASERAADTFELGQDPLDSLTGQTNIFDMPAEAPAPAPAASANTVFTEDAAAKARERLKKKLGRLNSGIDPEMMIDGITLAGYHIEKGARTFTAYARAMLADLGDGVRPYLKSWYMGVKYDPRAASLDGMDSAAAVESADVDAITAQENQDAAGANGSVEPDRQDAAAEPAMGDAVPADARGATRPAGQAGGQAAGEAGRRQPRGAGVPPGGPAAGGNRGDFLLPGGNAAADAANVSAGSDFSERGSDIGVDGVSTDPVPAAQVNAVAQTGNDQLSKQERQRAAEKVPVKPGDLDNIKATLPYLLAGQQEDVKKAEDRFAVPDGYGMLFTNGTGTGKTFTGLGVVKRMQRQGKTNTLIVVPDDKIAADWVESWEPLGLKITKLKDTQDAGKGIVITTYANLGENDALARRKWDLVVADESHTLMQSADGKVTTYLANLRAITHHPDGASQRHTMLNRDDLNRQRELTAQIEGNNKILNNLDTMDAMMESVRQENAKLQREADALAAELREAREAVQAEVDGMQGAKRARLLALSATPFAYEFTVDWANGYLFDYNEGQASDKTEFRGYNQGDNRERFFMQHFGYSMRYNKLTKPDPTKVDTGLLQRNFNGWLRKKGSLSARMLDVPADYDRRFVLVDSGIGNQIDEALNWVSEMAREDANKNGYSALRDVISKKFDFLSRRYLLEAIKATEVIPIVRQHLALGRKVVVFHDYKKGGGFNPFDIEVPRTLPEDFPDERKADFEAYKEALTEFRSRFKRLVNAPLSDLDSPIEVFKRELPDTMLVNGDEKKADLLERYKRFQDDASGPQVMLVQSAKNKGWSGHDTTGKHQRVLINLGQPTAPTLAIQQEGRIYRTGQVSDAIMRYLNTGTNWEKWTFATTIAGRASTAENLGMGEQARALKDSFISAFEESDTYEPGHEGEGKGGKERDQMANAAITAYDRAKTYYWATQKKNSKTKAQEGVDYFATPEPVGFKMAEWLGLRGGESSLEPSAGHGAIARWLPEISNRTVIEPSTTLRARLAMAMDASKDRIIDGTFEDHNIVNKYDGIAMNPPFGAGGKTAIEHLAKAVTHLRDGGRIVALIPTGPAADKRFDKWMYGTEQRPAKPLGKTARAGEYFAGDIVELDGQQGQYRIEGRSSASEGTLMFRRVGGNGSLTGFRSHYISKLVQPGDRTEAVRPADGVYMVAEIKLPQVTFERAGTAVATRIVILEKQSNKDKAPNARPAIDLSDIQDIGQLFDEIEDISMPPRAMSAEQEAAAKAEREQAEREAKKAERAQAKAEGNPAAPKAPKAANPDAVGTVDRNGAEIITHTTGKGKVLTGIVRTDLLKDEAQKIDPFTFRKDGGWFIREVYLKPEGDAPAFSRSKDQTQTEAFKRWFGDSKVVDAEGNPLVVYHGTGADISVFNPEMTESMPAVFMTPSAATAGAYAKSKRGPANVMPLYVSLKNPAEITVAQYTKDRLSDIYAGDADGIIVRNWETGAIDTVIAFNPNDIKSAIGNRGTFDPANPDIRYSRGRPGSMTESAVRQVASTIAARWAQSPPVVVVQSMQDMRVPEAARLEDARQRAGGASGSPRGFYYRGQVYLVADGLTSVRDAAETLFHEALGHHGLRAMFGNTLDGILDQIAMARPDLMKPKAEEYGKDLKVQKQRREVAEEVLAEMAQTKPELGYVKRAIAAIRNWLRQNVPGFKDLQLTDAEIIRSYILPARGWVERGAQSAQPEIAMAFDRSAPAADQTQTKAFMRWFGDSKAVDASGKPLVVYHGTGADFSVFTRDRAGATSGAANAGMGFFFTDQPEVAGRYAAMSGGAQSVMPVYLSLQNPIRLTAKNMMEADKLLQSQMKPEHDGAIIEVAMRDGGVQTVFMAKESSQVKSSTGNNGDFDPANPDIRFSRSTLGNAPGPQPQNPTPLQRLKAKALQLTSPQAITSLIYEYQDKNIDLKRLRDHIKELGGTITDLNDAYLGEELYHKRVAKRTQDFLSEELKPLLADLRARGLDLPTLEQFLHARHAPEANKVLAERNPNAQMIDAGRKQAQQAVRALELQLQRAKAQGTATKAIEDALTEAREDASRWIGAQAFQGTEDERTSLSGMSDAAAKAFMDGLQPGQRVHLDALAAKVDAINAKTLDTLEKYGLMDKASMDAWRNTYQHYVPLHRDEAHPDAVSHPIGQGFSTKGAASKRRTGSNEKVTNILAHIAMQRESALTRGEKNRVAKKLYLMAAQNPDPEVWAVDKPPMTKTVDSETGFVRTNVDPTYKNKPNVVMVRISGKDQAIVFNERNPEAVRLAQSIKSADLGELNAFDSLMGKATRWLASVNTQYNPIFGIINFARDVQAAVLQLSTTPLRGQERAVAAGVPAALRGIYAEVRSRRAGAGRGTGDWAKLWEEMQDEGGTTGYRELFIDPAERVKALNKEIQSLERGQASELAHAVVDWLSDYNETMENAVRLSAYKVALDQGMSKERAASLAKNLTVNFNRRGRQTAKLGAYYAFLNAAIQGSTRMVETLRGPMGKKIMLGGVMIGAVNTLIAMTMMGAGGDDDNWAKIPDFVKERSVIVPLGREDYLAIPMPLGYHVLPNMGRKAVEMMLHNDPTVGAGKHVADMAKLVLDAFNPLGGSGNVAQMIAPTPIDPAVALMMNRDWTGKPIYREDSSSLDPTPGHTRTKDTASTFSKVVSEAIVKVTGGSDYQPGAVNWTPDQLDYVIGQLTGGLGRELMKVEQTATAPFTGDELPPYKVPLVGRVYGNTRGPASESDKFYENLTKLNGVEREIKGRARDEVEVDEYMASEPLADLVGLGNSAQNQISKLRQVRREVVRQGLPGYQSEVKELNQQIGDVMKTVNQEVRRAKIEAAK